MATNEVVDAQFEELILHTLHTMSDGTILITKKQNRVMQVNIEEALPMAVKTKTNQREINLKVIKNENV